MSGQTPWRVLAEELDTRPDAPERIAQLRAEAERDIRRYRRLGWRLIWLFQPSRRWMLHYQSDLYTLGRWRRSWWHVIRP